MWTNTSINTRTRLPAPQPRSPPACPAVTTADQLLQTPVLQNKLINLYLSAEDEKNPPAKHGSGVFVEF